ncbi:4-hydroxyphenylpyruvate dioxygenase [Legionella quinlivanii]|uniref:4-hydroxyphenylpyruvate dioxygenase n=1 Tax=Legionella quinlivanii TaxID=45073 RepID=A0A0W0Y0H4_9GAMM|nr:4-hydroxyphenylpyruvate dioxygenase [Legionella quinlivanii]KTD50475.1 4-hydroxyphenylpyruvate dioxygenase [Legionella quinlivanii]SEF39438.1 4-hydroxymandelate synthase [Legionella quinlivanii DSM 21216]STY12075.1 4-hydroxyphenylpyruvate dioxygenase [Legionella quinlivanii]
MENIDYIELYVSDLEKSVAFYERTFRLVPIACSDQDDYSSVLVQQGSIRLVLTSAKKPSSPVAQFIDTHGEGVKDIAFSTPQVEHHYRIAIQKGCRSVLAPSSYPTGQEVIHKATVSAFGTATHTFISRTSENSTTLPFFEPIESAKIQTSALNAIDHIAICVNVGEVDSYVNQYIDTYGFKQSHEEQVITNYSGMKSRAVQSANEQIKIVFVEPVTGLKTSQVAEFLQQFGGPGVQHIAFSTEDIVSSVQQLRASGLETLAIPNEYYNTLPVKESDCRILRQHSILFDTNEQGSLYQIFSKSVVARATLFFEVIQRVGCTGFGSNNIKALFQAIEQEQFKRATALM